MEKADSSNLIPLDSQVQVEFSYPLSVPSQPLDIGNWFSSYEYESPDSCNDNDDYVDETQIPFDKSKDHDFIQPYIGDDIYIPSNQFYHKEEEMQLKDNSRATVELKRKRLYEKNGAYDLSEEKELTIGQKACVHQEKYIKKEHSDSDDCNSNEAQNMQRSESSKEKSEANTSTNGFISLKKKDNVRECSNLATHKEAENADVVKKRTHEQLVAEENKENNEIFVEQEKLRRREVQGLADRDNGEGEQLVPGKWQCPRKKKPYVGPPLKQLRLEQWVRRTS